MTDGMPKVPAGPWLAVLGMHRSGTSAVTGALGALGFNLPAPSDQLDPHESNPDHFESLSIMRVNDALLKVFGGGWDSPPELPPGFRRTQRGARTRPDGDSGSGQGIPERGSRGPEGPSDLSAAALLAPHPPRTPAGDFRVALPSTR